MITQPARRGLLAGLVAWLFMLGTPAPAHAHANFVDSDPADGEVVATAPEVLTVRFDESIRLASVGTQLFDAQGEPVAAELATRDAVLEVTPATTLADGTYVLSWRLVSADGHPVSGGITFSVGAPSDTVVTVPDVQGEREVALLKWIAELIRYAGVLVFAGLAVFATFLAAPVARRHEALQRRLDVVVQGAGLIALVGALALIALTALWESGEGLSAAGAALGRSGPATAAAALVALAVSIGWVALRQRHAPLTVAAIALALGSLVIVGHTRSYGPWWVVVPADALHVVAAATWIGGVVGLLLVLFAGPRPRDAAETVGRFSALAAWAVLLLAVSATVMYWRIAGSWEGLWATTYGRLVLAKLAAAVLVAGIGWWNRRRLVPLIARSKDATRVLRKTLGAEAALLVVIVGLTSALVAAAPPIPTPTTAAQRSGLADVEVPVGDTASARIRVTPAERGANTIEVAITDDAGAPLDVPEAPRWSAELADAGVDGIERPLTPIGPGRYEARADFPIAGTWTLRLSVRLSRFEAPVVSVQVPIR